MAIVPDALPAAADTLTLTAGLLAGANGTSFRAGAISTAPDLAIPAQIDLGLLAGERVSFPAGLTVALGARLRARAGF